jgi:hypothetical protein
MIDLSRRSLLTGAAVIGTVSAFDPLPGARAAAPVAGKQNAGWYRYKVGDFEVTVVTDGMNANPLSDAYVSNAPKADVNAALEADFLAKDKVTHAYTPVVINTGSKLVAIDTGLGLGMFEQSKGAVGQFQLAGRGYRPQCSRCRHHFALPCRSHQRPCWSREQASIPECRNHGTGGRGRILGR